MNSLDDLRDTLERYASRGEPRGASEVLANARAELTARPQEAAIPPKPADRNDNATPQRRRAPLAVAAAVIVVMMIAAAVVVLATRAEDSGRVTTVGSNPPTTGAFPAGLPRLAPATLPSGYALDQVHVTAGPAVKLGWVRRYEWQGLGPPYGRSDKPNVAPAPIELRVASADTATTMPPPITNPSVAQQVDVNGQPGWVNGTLDYFQTGDNQKGFTVIWNDATGARVDLSTHGVTRDQALTLANAVRVDGNSDAPTGTIDSITSQGYGETYAGPDLSPATAVDPQSKTGSVQLEFRNLGPVYATNGNISYDPGFHMTEVTLPPEVDPTTWLTSRASSSQGFTSNGMTFVATPATGTGSPSMVFGASRGIFVSIFSGPPLTSDDLRQVAQSLRTLGPSDWSTYLASARSTPFPARTERNEDVSLCAHLRTLASQNIGFDPANRPDGSELLDIASTAPEPQAQALRTIADYLKKTVYARQPLQPTDTVPWRETHDDIVSLRSAVQTLESWTSSHCVTDPSSASPSAEVLRHWLPNLMDQQPELSALCQAWQQLWRSHQSRIPGQPGSRPSTQELDALLPLIPATTPEVSDDIRQIRDQWATLPEGEWPKPTPNDRSGYTIANIWNRCPDWPS